MLAGVVAAVVAIAEGWLFFTQTDIGKYFFAATLRSIGIDTSREESDTAGVSQIESKLNHTAHESIASGKVEAAISDYQDQIAAARMLHRTLHTIRVCVVVMPAIPVYGLMDR